MDSSIIPPSTTSTNCKNSMTVQSKRAKFLSTYLPHQNWSIPDSIIYYISKNPSTPKIYQKLIQSCKYFFIKNPILVVPTLHFQYKDYEWHIRFTEKEASFKNISSNIWITEKLYISDSNEQNSLSTLIPKIYQCDAKTLDVCSQICSINDLKFLGSKCENVWFFQITVLKDDGRVATLENVFEIFPNVREFTYDFGENGSKIISSKTVSELLKIPHFSNLSSFSLREISETFDIETFYDFIKSNNKTKVKIGFCHQISDGYRNRLQAFGDEIIATEILDYKVPSLFFSRINAYTYFTLLSLHNE